MKLRIGTPQTKRINKAKPEDRIGFALLIPAAIAYFAARGFAPVIAFFGVSQEPFVSILPFAASFAGGLLIAFMLRQRGAGLVERIMARYGSQNAAQTDTPDTEKATSANPYMSVTPKIGLIPEIHFATGLVLIVVTCLMVTNTIWDKAQPNVYMVPITETHEVHSSKGNRVNGWRAEFLLPDALNLPGQKSEVRISAEEYRQIVPGRDMIEVSIKPGHWKWPWLAQHDLIIRNPRSEYRDNSPNLPPVTEADKTTRQALIDWRVPEDEVSRNTGNVISQKWPSGQLMQSEPHNDKGEIEGLASYWYVNGRKYGDIPYWHGQKHGRFKLYRENGTRDQSLSYRNGQPHGLLCWYGDDGIAVKVKGLYDNGMYLEQASTALPACP